MRFKFTLALAAIAFANVSNAQSWINDSVITENGYLTNVFYSLENGSVGTASASNWHIGLSTSRFSEGIITNSADKGVKLYELAVDTALFGTNLTADLNNKIAAQPKSLYNSNNTWFKGAFNYGSSIYGWATYDMSSHNLVGTRLFGLITGTDTLQVFIKVKQTTPSNNAPVYIIKTAKLDGTNPQIYTKNINSSAGRNYTYLNILDGTIIEREPLSANWDFVFTNYNDSSIVFDNMQYKVFGILNNEGLRTAKVDTVNTEFNNLDYSIYNYDTVINAIGKSWKISGQSGTSLKDSTTYFVKVKNGDVWQMVFTAHNTGSATTDPGLVAFKKRKVYSAPIDTGTSVKSLNAKIGLFTIAPNPSKTNSNIVLDAKNNLGSIIITITDINGRTIQSFAKNISVGLHQIPLQTNNLAAGMYIIKVQGDQINIATKMIKE